MSETSAQPNQLPGEPPPDPIPPPGSAGLGFGQNTPISTLPPVVALVGDESIPVVQNDPFGTPVTMRATPQQIAATLPVDPGAVPQAFAQNQTIISGPAPDFAWTPVAFNELGIVSTWNGQIGDVVMVKADVTGALGFTPYDAANPQHFQTGAQVTAMLVASASNATPLIDGTPVPGTSNQFARGDHVHPTDTSRYSASNPSNFQTGAQVTAQLAGYLPLTGGTVTGGTAFSAGIILATPANLNLGGGSPGNVLTAGATPGQVVWAGSAGGIPDAPTDGQTYGRNTGTWVVVSGGGGVSDSPADGTLYGRVNPTWRHIVHTDITDWTATLAPYALTANVPVASTTTPLADGTAAVGTGTTWARADHVHPAATIPPPVIISATPPTTPVVGTLWWDSVGGQLYVWYNDGTSSQWVIAVNTGGGASISVGPTPPSSPASGALWWDAVGGQLYVWYVDSTSSQWAPTTNQMGGNFLPISGGTLSGTLTVGGQLTGGGTTTNDSAAPGQIGEIISTVTTSAASFPTGVTQNIAAIALTPGDWDVSGEFWLGGGTTGISAITAGINTVSGTLPNLAMNTSRFHIQGTLTGPQVLGLRTCRFSVSATTTVYLMGYVVFSGGTATGTGLIWARRAR